MHTFLSQVPPISPGALDTLVYFVITNVEHDVAHSTNTMTTRDQYLDATVGELGCWVNPEVTRIVQEGVEHARPPTLTSTKGVVWFVFVYRHTTIDVIVIRPDFP